MIVAVTGAAGFLGLPLCRHLAARGHAVRALVRDPRGFVAANPGMAAARCELPDVLDASVLAGADVLIHAAWATKETDPGRARRVNDEGTRRVLAAARQAGIGRAVFVSTVSATADAPSVYGRSKFAAEALFDPSRDAIVRPGLILAAQGAGLFQQLIGAARALHVVPLFGGGHQPLQTIHVDDVCEGIVRVVEQGVTGGVNLAEPDPMALGAFLREATRLMGIRCAFVPVPFGPALAGLRVAERLRIPLPLRSESLLGMQGLRRVPVADDLARLGLRVRPARESLAAIAAATRP